MRPILTPAEAAELDRGSQDRGISVDTLMENAGRETARVAADVAGGTYGRRAVVVCGKGNNGGDGLVAARHLAAAGLAVTIVLLEPVEGLRGPAAVNLGRLEHSRVRVRAFAPGVVEREAGRADVAVDAIFGTGFRGRPEGATATAIDELNGCGASIVAVDIPSGVNGDSGAVAASAIWADVTVTFGALKPGLVLLPGAERAGVLEVVDIGFPQELVRGDLWLIEEDDVAAMLPSRALDTHKRASGVVIVIGGSRLMTGAVCLAAQAAYRAGAGLVTMAVPKGILPVVQTVVREATFVALPETADGTIAAMVDPVVELLAAADAVAIGPGMTTQAETAEWIRTTVRSCPVPTIVDADGLNAFAGRAGELGDRRSEVVLTPHAGEFARLSGTSAGEIATDRIGSVRKLSAETNATVLLKGTHTLIGSPDGVVRVNPTGGPFLATGGTGDVLTGAIAGLLARGLAPADAASAGAFLHGLAGARAARETGEGTTAGDVLGRLAEIAREVRSA